MQTVRIIAVGKLKEAWMREGIAEYSKRLESFCRFSVVELDEYRLPENPSPAQIQKGLEEEGKESLKRTGKAPFAALCIEGKQMSSPELADWLSRLQQESGELAFVIGGSLGLSEEVKQRARIRLSVSKMTFPHQLFRVMLSEQIYRAFSILAGSKYHK